jgi:hypothetical protein
MRLSSLGAALLLSYADASTVEKRTILIPKTVFDTTASLEQYFTYNYPWGGNTHNGGARMDKAHVTISSPSTLTITDRDQLPLWCSRRKATVHDPEGWRTAIQR